MKAVWFACVAGMLAAVPAAAQDPLKVAPNIYHLIAENDRVRVLHVTIPVGGKAPMHEHPANLIVSLSPATVTFSTPDGKSADVTMKADQVVAQPAQKHASENKGAAGEVIVIELKGTPGTAMLPGDRPNMKSTTLVEDANVKAVRVTIDPAFKEAAGSAHDYHQVVIPLSAADVKLTVGGKAITSWKRGDAVLIGKGVPHESGGGKAPGDVIIVAIK
jgi:quercetin dioxygenase-like cupin family protein